MLRIQDPKTDTSLEVHVPWNLEEAFRIQLERQLHGRGRLNLALEMSGWLAVALYQMVDRDLLPPTQPQRSLAEHMCRVLCMELPAEANTFRGTMADFIRANMPAFHNLYPPSGTKS